MVSRSMAARLTVALSLLAVLVFSTVALLLQRALQDELDRTRRQDLAGKVDVVPHFLEEVQETKDLLSLRHRLDDALIGDGEMRIWLITNDGVVLYGGRQRPEVSQSESGEMLVRREDGLPMKGQRINLSAHPIIPPSELIVAVDTREQEALLRRYRNTIATVCGLGVALTVLVTAWIARHALQPVKRLSREAAGLSPHALSARLSPVDTAELQILVEAFNRALDRVESAYEKLAGFSADVAHELRTPLATMINATEVALRRPRSTDELRETLMLNLEVLREQSGLVNDMLFLAGADRGQLADSLQPTDLRHQAERVAEYFEPLLEDKHQRIAIEGAVTVTCNPSLIRRALVNLVGNATRYTEAHGTITITMSERAGMVRLAVCNPGPPIPPEALPHLFDRFFRVDRSRKRSGGHHGLGLAIVRAIALMHSGSTFAHCAQGITEVGFEFPRADHSERSAADFSDAKTSSA